MKQRALLAQALVTQPRVLILDEPTVGLDPQQRSLFRSLLVELAKDRTVILSTHLIEDLQSLDARILVLDRGQAAFIGSLKELADIARGRVAIEHSPPMAGRYWQHSGTYRVVGPPTRSPVEPLPEDGYLDLVGQNPQGFDTASGVWGRA
jgi:ABC-type multidrug transport system ATPase subunit